MDLKNVFPLVFIFFSHLSTSYASEYMTNPNKAKDDEEFDGVTIVLLKSAKYCDRTTKFGDKLRVYYNASLTDGTEIESNFGSSRPLEFVLGEGQVIQGWESGLRDMCIGELRHLSIPSKYAYGDSTPGARFPPRATLHFTVELVGFDRMPSGPQRSNMFAVIDANKDGLLSREEVSMYLRHESIQDRPGEEGLNSLLHDIFMEEDRNKDGLITLHEFGGQKRDEL